MSCLLPSTALVQGILRVGKAWPEWMGATLTSIGQSPWQVLGRVWDTRPDETAPQDDIATAVGAGRAPGGLTLRAGYQATTSMAQRFGPRGPLALQLYVAAWDYWPDDLTNSVWPGPKTQGPHGFVWPFADNYNPALVADRVKVWAARQARLALDVAPYLAQPGAEVDLVELAGGRRYILAFWRAVNVLTNTVDNLETVAISIPWSLHAERAVHPVHRDRWFVTEALLSPPHAFAGPAADVFNDPARHCGTYTPTIAGTAALRVSNGATADICAGLEEWAAGPAQRTAAAWVAGAEYAAKLVATQPVAGALALYAAHDDANDDPQPALYHFEVTR